MYESMIKTTLLSWHNNVQKYSEEVEKNSRLSLCEKSADRSRLYAEIMQTTFIRAILLQNPIIIYKTFQEIDSFSK